MTGHGHDFECLGECGGWEVWCCKRCQKTTFPSVFGFLWPVVLGTLFRRFRCLSKKTVQRVMQDWSRGARVSLPDGVNPTARWT